MVEDVTITDHAAAKIRLFLAKANEGHGQVFEKNGARVLLDPQSFLHLNGTELDYKDELMQSAFVFNNPNVKGHVDAASLLAPDRLKRRERKDIPAD